MIRRRQERAASSRKRVGRHNREIVSIEANAARDGPIRDDGRLILVETCSICIELHVLNHENHTAWYDVQYSDLRVTLRLLRQRGHRPLFA
jgi:hypothetical protein